MQCSHCATMCCPGGGCRRALPGQGSHPIHATPSFPAPMHHQQLKTPPPLPRPALPSAHFLLYPLHPSPHPPVVIYSFPSHASPRRPARCCRAEQIGVSSLSPPSRCCFSLLFLTAFSHGPRPASRPQVRMVLEYLQFRKVPAHLKRRVSRLHACTHARARSRAHARTTGPDQVAGAYLRGARCSPR